MENKLKITFGMIVLNGEPFVRYNLRALYPFDHQIIVIEGACRAAEQVARPDGHSKDGTLEILYQFKQENDPDGKIMIVCAEDEGHPNGFWPGEKDEMSQTYARRATGNYLWQIDSDEFYNEEQMKRLIIILKKQRPDTVSFPTLFFWGGMGYITNGFSLIRDNTREFHRVFAWGPGYCYKTHFPPTVIDENGIDLRQKHWIRACLLEKQNIFLYHYFLLFPSQVFNKVKYYKSRNNNDIDLWEESIYQCLKKPFRIHNVDKHISWIERFTGDHPAVIYDMMHDIKQKKTKVELRDCIDVELLLSKKGYVLATKILNFFAHVMTYQPFKLFYRIYTSIQYRLDKLSGNSLK